METLSEKIKKALGEKAEEFGKLLEIAGLKAVVGNDGTWMPKETYDNDLTKKLKEKDDLLERAQSELESTKTALQEIEPKNKEHEGKILELKTKLENYQTESATAIEKAKKDAEFQKQERLLDVGLLGVAANKDYLEFLKTKVKRDELVFTDTEVVGLDKQIEAWKDNEAMLPFISKVKVEGIGSLGKGQNASGAFFTEDQVNKMSDAEVVKNLDAITESQKLWS